MSASHINSDRHGLNLLLHRLVQIGAVTFCGSGVIFPGAELASLKQIIGRIILCVFLVCAINSHFH